MKKDSAPAIPHENDRKYGQEHSFDNTLPNKRDAARAVHTNHFTNREGHGEKK